VSATIARVRIVGRVQGVWFRGWTVQEARRLGLEGWVRNRLDGSVEALFSGPRDAVEAMVSLCQRGPSAARVLSVQRLPAGSEELTGAGFVSLPTR
jgi:acylphosphatase